LGISNGGLNYDKMKVSLVCIAKNEDNYIQEWIDYYFKIGVDDIHIYMNDWRIDINQKNVYTYELDGIAMQLVAYNDFIKNKSEEGQWAAFFDVDEFLVLKKHSNIKEFLSDYSEHQGVGVNWVLFGDNGLSLDSDNFSLVNRFTKRQIGVNPHIKTILKISNNVYMPQVHHPNVYLCDTNHIKFLGPFNPFGDDSIAQINHYFCKTREEFVNKVNRGKADSEFSVRTMVEFDLHNKNEIDDFTLYNFVNNV
jgi:hypothetical protein